MNNQMMEMIALFKKELELCKLTPDETMAVLTYEGEFADYAFAFMEAAKMIGAKVIHYSFPRIDTGVAGSFGYNPLTYNPVALESLKKVDLIIDMVQLLFSKEQKEIQEAGTRILLVIEPFEVIKRMFPKEDDKRRVLLARQYLAGAKELRFTNKAGTDVTYKLGQYGVLTEYGFADEPGKWDHLPSCFAATCGNDGEVDGVVVLDRGDIIYPLNRYVQDPVKMTIKDGYVVSIEGGVDAVLLKEYMDSYNDPRGYAISHIGFGLNERAQWSHLALDSRLFGMDGRAYYGNVLFSTGPNNEFGGTNDTHCHIDIPMKDCTLYLDGKLIVKDGEIVIPELRPQG